MYVDIFSTVQPTANLHEDTRDIEIPRVHQQVIEAQCYERTNDRVEVARSQYHVFTQMFKPSPRQARSQLLPSNLITCSTARGATNNQSANYTNDRIATLARECFLTSPSCPFTFTAEANVMLWPKNPTREL